ncbi:MAG: ribosome-associated translation inhibitor RaiA [Aeriscardovia sp.]|nr:ribosome-associated translation inhibitor RaiA [Aeriscardovia sp.]
MDIVITGRRTKVSEKFRTVVDSKSKRIAAIAPDADRVQIVVTHEGNPRQADTAIKVEITVFAGRDIARAEASSADAISALDLALDKLTIRLRRLRDRRKNHRQDRDCASIKPLDTAVDMPSLPEEAGSTGTGSVPLGAEPLDADGESVEVRLGETPIRIRRKLHRARQMTIEEALYEMELSDHDFYLFVNAETRRPAVVYRRHGWSYGVFEIDSEE